MTSLLDDLRSEIAKGHVVAVVGAGVSIAATKRDPLASWTGLLKSGVERCGELGRATTRWMEHRTEEIDKPEGVNELLLTAENISWKLGYPSDGEYARWLRETVGSLRVKDDAVLKALRDLRVTLATTNYDGLLEAPDLPAVTWREGAARMERVVHGDERGILHLHGYWDEPESVVFGLRSYEQVLGNAHAQAVLQALRMAKTLLFVGCGEGLADPNFAAFRRWSRDVFEKSPYRCFRLCRSSELDALRKEHLDAERILPLAYGADFGDLVGFLRGLKPETRSRPTSPAGGDDPMLPGLRICLGREGKIRELVDSVCTDPPPPVPVLGQAGIGKSTLVTTALHDPRVAARFGNRRFFVRCDGAIDSESLTGEIARRLGLEMEKEPERTRKERLFRALEAAPLVLAIDDPETPYWEDPSKVEELLSQLASVPGLALVLSLRGEQRPLGPRWREAIWVPALDRPAARDVFLAVAGERFRSDPHLDALLTTVDGWPLVLTLLAHQAEIEPDLSSLLRRLESGRIAVWRSGAGEGRLNVEVSLELSIASRRMTPESRRLLALLSVLPEGIALDRLGSFFPEAPGAAPVLRQVGLAQVEKGRIRALQPVREYVWEVRGVSREDLDRAVKHYLQWAQEVQQSLDTEALELAHLAQEFGNLEALVIASLTPPATDAEPPTDTGHKIRSVLSLSSLLSSAGLSRRAPRIVRRALRRAEEIGDESLQGDCQVLLGDIARVRPDFEEARRAFSASVELGRRTGNLFLEAVGISRLGAVEQSSYHLEEARRLYETANGLFARLGIADEQARCLLGLAKIHWERDFTAAETVAREALDLLGRKPNEVVRANCLNLLGEIALEIRDSVLARERFEAAKRIYEELALPLGRANCLRNLARAALQAQDAPASSAFFSEALDLYELIGNQQGVANCLEGLGDLIRRVDAEAAKARYKQALDLYQAIGDFYLAGRAHSRLAGVTREDERHGHLEAAREAWSLIGRSDLIRELPYE